MEAAPAEEAIEGGEEKDSRDADVTATAADGEQLVDLIHDLMAKAGLTASTPKELGTSLVGT